MQRIQNSRQITLSQGHINKNQLALPDAPSIGSEMFKDVKPGQFFRKGPEGLIFYCSRSREEWQEKIVYRVYADRSIPTAFTERDNPPNNEVVDIIEAHIVKAL